MIDEGREGRSPSFKAPLISVVAVGACCLATLAAVKLGPLSSPMLGHITTMNILAPLLAAGIASRRFQVFDLAGSATLWGATFVQMALLWGWHVQAAQHAAHASPALALISHAALLIAAIAFWCTVIASAERPWQTILALLLSGKLVCLLGALLVFSPRLLIQVGRGGHEATVNAESALADQHLAGLLMLAACPLSYILAAIVITSQEISCLQRRVSRIAQHPIRG